MPGRRKQPAKPVCPQADRHTPCPQGYIAWHRWAERMNKTHRQVRCPGCSLMAIWVPRKKKTNTGSE